MNSLEQQTVADVIALDPAVSRTLREYRIDPTRRMRLDVAAAAVSAHPEEILAVAEVRMRRAARVRPAARFEYEHEYEHELAFA